MSRAVRRIMGKKEHPLGSLLGCLVIVFAVHCMSANCQDSRDDSGIPLPIYDEGCNSLMKALHQEWVKSDGEKTFVVAGKLIWALLLNPNAFYAEFSPDSVHYRHFSDGLDALVFRNFNDTTTAHLERQRVVAIERLVDQTYSVEAKYLHLHEEMIAALTRVKVSHVD